MFKQITNLNGDEYYLLFSLVMFFIFFIVIGITLTRMNKNHIQYMSDMPMEESDKESTNHSSENQA